MTYEHKPNTGSLFRNDRREKDTHPHAQGSALIDGVEYWLSAWTNRAKDGSPYQSLKFTRKEQNTRRNESKYEDRRDERRSFPPDNFDDSDFPF